MKVRARFCAWTIFAVLLCAPLRQAAAADLNIYFHLYTFEGMTIGEFRFDNQVAFRLRIAKDGAQPVISLQKADGAQEISPDITNGMFMLRLN